MAEVRRLRSQRAGRHLKQPTLPEKELEVLKRKFAKQFDIYWTAWNKMEELKPEIMQTVAELSKANLSQKSIAEIAGCSQQWVSVTIDRARKAGLMEVEDQVVPVSNGHSVKSIKETVKVG